MMTLAQRVKAAIKASGKTAAQVAREVETSRKNVSNIVTGENVNPTYQLLVKIAQATGTTVGVLAGESIQISRADETALTVFREWIDGKLATIDAREHPNAEIVPASELAEPVVRIADALFPPPQKRFADASLVLRALGDSMRDAGILAGDTLYASTRPRSAAQSALGKIIACRIGDDVFVKRLTSERRRHFLLSANPRYRAIEVAPDDPTFVILGVVIGRAGRVE
ncbi:MAG TPA: S24 family peptidase [Thermoanaerobaculia bacterium]|nr:S24 family peptidase [Thermoanaerobaculia bacterium]